VRCGRRLIAKRRSSDQRLPCRRTLRRFGGRLPTHVQKSRAFICSGAAPL
jgi:hypothetical protein